MNTSNWKILNGQFITIIIVLNIFSCTLGKAQSIFEGQVLDSALQEPIASVTVTLLGKKIATSTTNQGYYKIVTEDNILSDTLSFSSIGYLTYRLPVSSYKPNSIIILKPSNANLAEVTITNRKLKQKRLNGFGLGQLVPDTIYVPTPYSTQYAFAKYFNAPNDNVILTTIEIGRIKFEVLRLEKLDAESKMEPLTPVTKTNPKTRFLVHILSVNPKSKLPDEVLLTKPIALDDNSIWVSVDLVAEKFVLKSKEFFVAIEWLRVPYNETFKLDWAPRVRTTKKNGKEKLEDVSQYITLYQPALASYPSTDLASSFIKNKDGLWVPALNDKEIALSAIIKY